MKTVYLKNFRKGFATNSSSTHSVIYKNKDDMFKDLNIFELDFYDRFDNTIAASKEAKIKYVAANIMWNEKLYEIMCAFYPDMKKYEEKIKKERKSHNEDFGMYARGSLYFPNSIYLEASIDYLRNIIEDDDIIIIGGSDEEDFVYCTKKNHEELPEADSIGIYDSTPKGVVKNGNYWVGYGYDGKIRFKTEKGKCIPFYPELIDLCITKNCNHNCNFCYMNAGPNGKHADIASLKRIIGYFSNGYGGRYNTRIEFSVGGGNVLLYPQLDELFRFMYENGHIINTTINAKDCEMLLSDESILNTFKQYVRGIGISISEDKDIEMLSKLNGTFVGDNYKDIVIHLIPEMLGVDKTREFIVKLKKYGYNRFLFLGYKTNGRGVTQKHVKLTKNDLDKLFDDLYCVSVDTTFAKTYDEWLNSNYETEHTITKLEGEYSMYIDGVEGIAYKSSYQLNKPYNINIGNYKDYNEKWFNPIDAFHRIRKDNGLENYEENS